MLKKYGVNVTHITKIIITLLITKLCKRYVNNKIMTKRNDNNKIMV